MLRYERGESCLMRQLRAELDDPTTPTAGGAPCAPGRLPLGEPSADTVRAAMQHLRAQTVDLEPRKMWPAGAPRRGRIAEAARAEPGRALALAEDPAWRDAVSAALQADQPVSSEVFDGLVGVLSKWGWPAGRPTWVTWVPSRRHGALLGDLAERGWPRSAA